MTRLRIVFALLLLGFLPRPVRAWNENGVPVCTASGYQGVSHITGSGSPLIQSLVPDGVGGAFICWEDVRTSWHIYAQHLDAGGNPVWSANGVFCGSLSGEADHNPAIASDGTGGAIVVWATNTALLGQRIDASGTTRWGTGGKNLYVPPPNFPQIPYAQLIPDGAGGAIVTWDGRDTSSDIFAVRVDSSGAQRWLKVVCAAVGKELFPRIVPDAAGGAIIAWADERSPVGSARIYAQRLDASGNALWTADGRKVIDSGDNVPFALAPDDSGGALVAVPTAVYVQRVNPDGVGLWGISGASITSGGLNVSVVADGARGAIVSWLSQSFYSFLGHVGGSGTVQWTTQVSSTAGAPPVLLSCGTGGAFVAWTEFGVGGHVAKIRNDQSEDWRAPTVWGADAICSDGRSGVITAAGDDRNAGTSGTDLFAGQVHADGTTPVLVSLISADAEPGRVSLRWFISAGLAVSLWREQPGGAWQLLANSEPAGNDIVSFEDRDVLPGKRYGYRLALQGRGAGAVVAETWVEVPVAPTLALTGVRPNPSDGDLAISFSLPSPTPARLELLDLAGRLVRTQKIEPSHAGAFSVVFRKDNLPPGIYAVRLMQTGQSRVLKACVIR